MAITWRSILRSAAAVAAAAQCARPAPSAMPIRSAPDAVEALLYTLPALPTTKPETFAAIGTKRDIARIALAKLRASAPEPKDLIALPVGSPYGRIRVDVPGCTLCLACVGACPAN